MTTCLVRKYSLTDVKKSVDKLNQYLNKINQDLNEIRDGTSDFYGEYQKKDYLNQVSLLTLENKINNDIKTLDKKISSDLRVHLIEKIDTFLKKSEQKIEEQNKMLNELQKQNIILQSFLEKAMKRIESLEEENMKINAALIKLALEKDN